MSRAGLWGVPMPRTIIYSRPRIDDDDLSAEVARLRRALKDITEMPLDGDYDYYPGVSERLAAQEALDGYAR